MTSEKVTLESGGLVLDGTIMRDGMNNAVIVLDRVPQAIVEILDDDDRTWAAVPAPLGMLYARGARRRQPPAKPVEKAVHAAGRNHPCPCGSGKKFKRCCHPAVQKPASTPSASRKVNH